MNKSIVIESKNLCFCPFQEKDFDLFYEIYSDKKLMKYVNKPLDREQAEIFFKKTLKQYTLKKPKYFIGQIIDKQNKKIGLAGIFWNHEDARSAEVGAMLLANNSNKGYGSEVFKAIMKELFTNRTIDRVVYCHHPQNTAAHNICQSLGCQIKEKNSQTKKTLTTWSMSNKNFRKLYC